MDKEDKDYSIQTALRFEFETANKDRAIEIYNTSKVLGYDEQAEEMKQDIYIEFNIEL
ncbi:MAG: hypothetical protein GY793_01795 [Proteobacteria bacterium]|nr:hypothetical protein [Pseudomonadota bacterium]